MSKSACHGWAALQNDVVHTSLRNKAGFDGSVKFRVGQLLCTLVVYYWLVGLLLTISDVSALRWLPVQVGDVLFSYQNARLASVVDVFCAAGMADRLVNAAAGTSSINGLGL